MAEIQRALRAMRRRSRAPETAPTVDIPDPRRYDPWLGPLLGAQLDPIEAACAEGPSNPLGLFSELDDEVWALLLTGEYTLYPHIRRVLPEWPDYELQQRWNGWTGLKLLNESKSFYARVRRLWASHSARSLASAKVLDFGCGWGRLTRFFARDVAPGSLYGCDPVQDILDVCERTRVPAVFARSEHVPERLPFDQRFDLVFAFSVFTHLAEPAHEAALRAIHASLEEGGLLVASIRPPAYLTHCEFMRSVLDDLGDRYPDSLRQPRYLFLPHPAETDHPQYHEGEMSYGETVITLAYVRERWSPLFELLDVGLLTEDLHQVVLTLRRRG